MEILFFSFQFCEVSFRTKDHPQGDLMMFDHRRAIIVELFLNHFMSWLLV
jgi:hypothetical protein